MANGMHRQRFVVVVGVDAGETTDHALREAARLAANFPQTDLHLVHAAAPYPAVTPSEGPTVTRRGLYEQHLKGLPPSFAERIGKIAAQEGFAPPQESVHVHVRTGRSHEVVLDLAQELGADLVVVGSHGRAGLSRWVLGSTSEVVVRHASCPVLVARPHAWTPSEQDQPEPPRYEVDPRTEHPTAEDFRFDSREHVRWTRDNPDTAGPI